MKCCKKIWKILGALLAVTATILVVVKFWDEILDGIAQLKEKFAELKCAEDACEGEDFLI